MAGKKRKVKFQQEKQWMRLQESRQKKKLLMAAKFSNCIEK